MRTRKNKEQVNYILQLIRAVFVSISIDRDVKEDMFEAIRTSIKDLNHTDTNLYTKVLQAIFHESYDEISTIFGINVKETSVVMPLGIYESKIIELLSKPVLNSFNSKYLQEYVEYFHHNIYEVSHAVAILNRIYNIFVYIPLKANTFSYPHLSFWEQTDSKTESVTLNYDLYRTGAVYIEKGKVVEPKPRQLSPIFIAEDILEDIGFTLSKVSDNTYYLGTQRFNKTGCYVEIKYSIKSNTWKLRIGELNTDTPLSKQTIKYVHQLQAALYVYFPNLKLTPKQ